MDKLVVLFGLRAKELVMPLLNLLKIYSYQDTISLREIPVLCVSITNIFTETAEKLLMNSLFNFRLLFIYA